MPPKKVPGAIRNRSSVLPTSAEAQSALLAEWRAKEEQDGEKFRRFSSKMKAHRMIAECSKRKSIWMNEMTSLNREGTSCQLELEKILLSCTASLPKSLLDEMRCQEARLQELTDYTKGCIASARKAFDNLQRCFQGGGETLEATNVLRGQLATLQNHLEENKRILDAESNDLYSAEDDFENDTSTETFRFLVSSTMETFARLRESSGDRVPFLLEETYQRALLMEEKKVMPQLTPRKENRLANLSLKDLRTVSLILKTYSGVSAITGTLDNSAINTDVYDRVQTSLGNVPKQSVRHIVDEVLKQKRDRIRARSAILEYRKKTLSLLHSFEKAVAAESEITEMQASIEKENKAREEQKEKNSILLDQLRASHNARISAKLEEAESQRIKEEKKKDHITRLREAEFQERLNKLQEYHEKQLVIEEKERAVRLAIEAEEAVKKAMQREKNSKRVEERRKEYEEKMRLRRAAQEEVENLKVAHAKVLESFFKSVEERIGVTRDAERVLQDTASRQSAPFKSFSEAAQFVLHGYTADDVMKDPRFRLQLALMDAGLHQTPYGREVIARGFRVPAAQRPSEDNPLRMDY